MEIGYVTDIEGNLEYFHRYVSLSEVVRFDGQGALELTHEQAYFVHGGDLIDKGPGDIRLSRLLVALKERYPDRVHLLVGNRDLNKLRLSAELSNEDMMRPVSTIPPPHWDPAAPTLEQHLQLASM